MKILDDFQRELNSAQPGAWLSVPAGALTSFTSVLTVPKGVGIAIEALAGAGTVRGEGTVSVCGDAFTLLAQEKVKVIAYHAGVVRMESFGICYAHGNARIQAYNGSRVFLLGAQTSAVAHRGSKVAASGTSHVTAWSGARVAAYEEAHVVSHGAHVTTHQQATVRGGNYNLDCRPWPTGKRFIRDNGSWGSDVAAWCANFGIPIEQDGTFHVYKGVGSDYCAESEMPDGSRALYAPGATLEAPDWSLEPECGQGLHFSPHPIGTLEYRSDASRFLRCKVSVDETVTLGDKIKCKRILEPGCVEVDILGEPILALP